MFSLVRKFLFKTAVTIKSMAASSNASSAVRALALELKNLQDDPLEGIQSRLVNEDNIFEWEVALFGPPDTLYQGGYFKVCCKAWSP